MHLPETKFQHVGFWRRVVEYIIDSIAIYIVVLIVAYPKLAALSDATQQFMYDSADGLATNITPQMLADSACISHLTWELWLIWMLVSVLDFVVLQGVRGQSLGKMVMGHQLVRVDGSHPKPGVIVGRFFAFWLSSLVLYIGFMMVGWNRKKQGLHDILCGTYVVRKPR